jgi:hypothetical protein
MDETTFETDLRPDLADGIVSAARTSLGDTLRSVVYFTPSAFDVLYVRRDLYDSTQDAREAKGELVELERVGFAETSVRTASARMAPASNIGRYEFTVRFHEDGFVIRVFGGDAGVVLTTDDMDVSAFEDAAGAIKRLLESE